MTMQHSGKQLFHQEEEELRDMTSIDNNNNNKVPAAIYVASQKLLAQIICQDGDETESEAVVRIVDAHALDRATLDIIAHDIYVDAVEHERIQVLCAIIDKYLDLVSADCCDLLSIAEDDMDLLSFLVVNKGLMLNEILDRAILHDHVRVLDFLFISEEAHPLFKWDHVAEKAASRNKQGVIEWGVKNKIPLGSAAMFNAFMCDNFDTCEYLIDHNLVVSFDAFFKEITNDKNELVVDCGTLASRLGFTFFEEESTLALACEDLFERINQKNPWLGFAKTCVDYEQARILRWGLSVQCIIEPNMQPIVDIMLREADLAKTGQLSKVLFPFAYWRAK